MSTSPPTPPSQPRRGWTGSTQGTQDNAAILGGKFWREGDAITCLWSRQFETRYGPGMEFLLALPKTLYLHRDQYGVCTRAIEGEAGAIAVTRFAMPPLAGFDMAVQDLYASGFDGFRHGDRCIIKCVGVTPPKRDDQSPMVKFEISVDAR